MRTTEKPEPLDVWLKFVAAPVEYDDPDYEDELADYEANTYQYDDEFVVEWYHNAVGLVSSKWFDTYEEATAWLESEGFEDFSS